MAMGLVNSELLPYFHVITHLESSRSG